MWTAVSKRCPRPGRFVGQHICVPLEGAAIHINAFNFPVWGMLEKLAPALLAGMPAIVKPATQTCYLAERVFRRIIESGLLPEGAVQLICGGVGDLFEHLTCQDVVSFTGSATTALKLRQHRMVLAHAVRFTAETDSLNSAILGPDVTAAAPEFDLFVREVVREMTVKAGQKCTAIRRALVPAAQAAQVLEALRAALGKIVVGDPRLENVRMGPVASLAQRREVLEQLGKLRREAEVVYGDDTKGAAGWGGRRARGVRAHRRCFTAAMPPKHARCTPWRPLDPYARSCPMRRPRRRLLWRGAGAAVLRARYSVPTMRSRRSWCSGWRPITGASWSSIVTAPRSPPVTVRPCRT